ncbi:MAG TPA: CDP-alcohol phosphatidyltransferase family protein, partial [Rhodanobacteraceae bacterium]|nr:CDP-alcohol phosphatidyltransferase family protein [Rhodanobacteraceae bacterium]
FLARRFGWFTRLGAWLDPAADKLMLMVAYLSLAWVGVTPWWLAALVVLRDVVIVAGALAYRWLRGALEVAPSRLSKINTLVQILYVLVILIDFQPLLYLNPALLGWLVAVLTVASGVDYVVRFARKAARKESEA